MRTLRTWNAATLMFGALALVGCGGGNGGTGGSGGTGGGGGGGGGTGGGGQVDMMVPPDQAPSPGQDMTPPAGEDMKPGEQDMAPQPADYPPMPHGGKKGEVIFNFEFEKGYFSPDKTSGTAKEAGLNKVTFSQLYKSGKKYAFIQLAGAYCSTCKSKAQDMTAKAATLVPKGALLMTILVEGDSASKPAEQKHLDAWINTTQQPFTTTLDAVAPKQIDKALGVGHDSWVLINLSNMKIEEIYDVRNGDGYAPGMKRLEELLK